MINFLSADIFCKYNDNLYLCQYKNLMKRIISHIFMAPVIMLYLLSYVGFGVHTCTCNNTRDFFLLLGDVSCENIHSHSHNSECCSGTECHHCTQHDDGCCSTEVIVLDDVQDSETPLFISAPSYVALAEFVVPETINFGSAAPSLGSSCDLPLPPLIHFDSYLPLFSQWRL